MTKQETKDELKQTEGDPQIKSRIRRVMILAARNRMMHNLPKADVIITNPTHYAVAIKNTICKKIPAPEVIAKAQTSLLKKLKKLRPNIIFR